MPPLPYQSLFHYRPRHAFVPRSPYGGLGNYTLGSLSPKTAYALPEYVRREPIYFMAGDEDEYEDEESVFATEDEEANGTTEVQPEKKSWLEERAADLEKYGKMGADLYKKLEPVVTPVVGLITGGSSSSTPSSSLPTATEYEYDYDYEDPTVYALPDGSAAADGLIDRDFILAQMVSSGGLPASFLTPRAQELLTRAGVSAPLSSSSTVLLVAAAGLAAFLLLK